MTGTWLWDRRQLNFSRPQDQPPSGIELFTSNFDPGWSILRQVVTFDVHCAYSGLPPGGLHQPAPLGIRYQLGIGDDVNSPEVIDVQELPMAVTYFNKEPIGEVWSYDWIGVWPQLHWDMEVRRSFGSYGGGPLSVTLTFLVTYFTPNFAQLLFPEIEARGYMSVLGHLP